MRSVSMIIDGQAVTARETFDVINPATEQVVACAPAGNSGHVDAAVTAARRAFAKWSRQPDSVRKEMLMAVAKLIEDNTAELVDLVVEESGKPIGGLNGVGAAMEVGGSIAWASYTASLNLPVDVIQDDEIARVEVHRKPLGVVASITPWNWPLMIAIWHIIPALRAGNTVVIKPSELTPMATARFVELANSILPSSVLNLVTGSAGSDVGPALVSHPEVDKVVFTGSTATGKAIMGNAAATLKRLTLELGGNDAAIVLPGANIQNLAKQLFGAAFHNNGQTCACLKRLYVHQDQYEEMCTALSDLARDVVIGDGRDPSSELGPIQNAAQLSRVFSLVESARMAGGRILAGGERVDRAGYFFAPTIIADLPDEAPLVAEEQFGPVLPVLKYSSIDEAIIRANNNPNGLGGSVWGKDIELAQHVASRLECGTVWVNEHGAIQPNAPFGGIKQSGIGVEFGRYGLEENTSIQTMKIMK